MPRPLEIACLQTRPMPDIESATQEALTLAEQAIEAGAVMLFLPEYCSGLKSDGARMVPPAIAEKDHPFLESICAFAAKHAVWINIGSIAVTEAKDKLLNRGYMIDNHGQVVGRYDKIHLFDIQLSENEIIRESETVNAGTKAVVHRTPLANIGHTICYDLRFPQLFRSLAQSGAEILACPAAFTQKTGQAHWHVLNRARAIENTRFVVSACAIGDIPGGGQSYGHSLIIGPWGDVIADGGALPGVVHARIDLDEINACSTRIPSLENGREFTLYENQTRNVA